MWVRYGHFEGETSRFGEIASGGSMKDEVRRQGDRLYKRDPLGPFLVTNKAFLPITLYRVAQDILSGVSRPPTVI